MTGGGKAKDRTKAQLLEDIQELNGKLSALEKQLQESSEGGERYRELFDAAPIGIYRTAPDGRVLLANPMIVETLGYESLAELQAKALSDSGFAEGDSRERFVEAIEKDGELHGYEAVWVRKDGFPLHVRGNARAVRDEAGNTLYYDATIEDVTRERVAEKALEFQGEFQHLITRIGARFVNMAPDEVDHGIREALTELGRCTDADRAYIFQVSADAELMSNTHEWAADNVESKIEEQRDLPVAAFPWAMKQIMAEQVVHVPRVADLPDEASTEKEEFTAQEILSLILIPLVSEGVVFGFLGLDAVWKERTWDDDSITLLRIAGRIFASTLERAHVEEELRYRVEFEGLITSISARFVNIQLDEVNDAIQEALEQIGEFTAVDQSNVYRFSEDGSTCECTHTWHAREVGGTPAAGTWPAPMKSMPETFASLLEGRAVCLSADDPSALQGDAERRHLEEFCIASVLRVPMSHGMSRKGFFGLVCERETRRWTDETVALLRMVGEIFASALDKQEATDALANERIMIHALMESVPDKIYFKDLKSRFVRMNRACAEQFGVHDPMECVGTCDHDYFAAEHADQALADERHMIETGEPIFSKEEKEVWPDGRVTWASSSKLPLRDGNGDIVGLAGITRDITQFKEAEEERLQMELRMQHTQKLESLGLLSGGIAHDFNNFLMGILGHTGLALPSMSPESPAYSSVKQIESVALRAAELTNQMLAYSGKAKRVVEAFDLSMMVREMGHLLDVTIPASVKVVYHFDKDVAPMEGDPAQIRQVVMNMITNASDAIGNKAGRITIGTSLIECDACYLRKAYTADELDPGRYVMLQVEDTGVGMDEETQAKIFDPFFTTKSRGRGLGLAAVIGIVRAHKGALKVYSEVGKGTCFKVLLPMFKGEFLSKEPEAKAEAWRDSGTVLVIDDDEIVCAVTEKILAAFGYDAAGCTNAMAALEDFKACNGDCRLVVLDVTIPEVTVGEMIKRLRAVNPQVPIILISGYSENSVNAELSGQTYEGFLQKPFNGEMLEKLLPEILGR